MKFTFNIRKALVAIGLSFIYSNAYSVPINFTQAIVDSGNNNEYFSSEDSLSTSNINRDYNYDGLQFTGSGFASANRELGELKISSSVSNIATDPLKTAYATSRAAFRTELDVADSSSELNGEIDFTTHADGTISGTPYGDSNYTPGPNNHLYSQNDTRFNFTTMVSMFNTDDEQLFSQQASYTYYYGGGRTTSENCIPGTEWCLQKNERDSTFNFSAIDTSFLYLENKEMWAVDLNITNHIAETVNILDFSNISYMTFQIIFSTTASGITGGGVDMDFSHTSVTKAKSVNTALSGSLVNPVPEPSAIALMGLGLLGFVATHRRKLQA